MKIINSLTNQEVKHVVGLHRAKGRKESDQFIAEGARVIKTFLDAGWVPEKTYIDGQGSKVDFGQLLREQFSAQLVSEAVMKKMSAATTPSGLLAVFSTAQAKELSEMNAPAVVLAKVSDPGNMGALIRSAAAFSFQVVVIEGADPWSPKVIQASAGALANLHIFQATWRELRENCTTKGLKLYALVARSGKKPEQITSAHQALLVVGSEAHGIPPEWENECDERITLQMSSQTESLNAAVAGSIAMYLLRQIKL